MNYVARFQNHVKYYKTLFNKSDLGNEDFYHVLSNNPEWFNEAIKPMGESFKIAFPKELKEAEYILDIALSNSYQDDDESSIYESIRDDIDYLLGVFSKHEFKDDGISSDLFSIVSRWLICVALWNSTTFDNRSAQCASAIYNRLKDDINILFFNYDKIEYPMILKKAIASVNYAYLYYWEDTGDLGRAFDYELLEATGKAHVDAEKLGNHTRGIFENTNKMIPFSDWYFQHFD